MTFHRSVVVYQRLCIPLGPHGVLQMLYFYYYYSTGRVTATFHYSLSCCRFVMSLMAVWSHQRGCFTLRPVSTWMGDCIRIQLPVTETYLSLTDHPGQLSLAIPPWIGGVSTGDGLMATIGEEMASSA